MDDKRFEQLIERSGAKLFEYLRLSLPSLDDAKDVYQESLISAWESQETFRSESDPQTWLFAIAKRRIADFYRKRRDVDELTISLADDDDFTQGVELRQTLDQLPISDQRLLFLIFQVGLSQLEIATLEDIPVGTVKSRFFTLKKRLRHMMEESHA